MKKLKRALLGIFSISLVAAASIGISTVSASTFLSDEQTTVSKNKTVDGSLYAAGSTIDIDGTVNGDVFCAGQTVSISGTVTGDVICAGQTINVTGTVGGNVRLAGQSITLDGSAGKNATVLGQTITTSNRSTIGADATVTAQTSTLNGKIGRDLVLSGNSAKLNGVVGRNVDSMIGSLTLASNANIVGTLNYTSDRELSRQDGAKVGGTINRSTPEHKERDRITPGSVGLFNIGAFLYSLVSLLLVSLVIFAVARRYLVAAAAETLRRPGRTFLVGLVASIVVPIAAVLLLLTFVGIPLGLLVLLAWLLILFLSGPMAAYLLGSAITRGRTAPLWSILIGSVILILLYLIPIINFFVILAVIWFGAGSILLYIYGLHSASATIPRPEARAEAASSEQAANKPGHKQRP